MSYEEKALKEAKEKLLIELRRNFTHDFSDRMVDALVALIDIKIKIATDDLRDEINKTGIYDSDY